jgi:hypothetical protein
LKVPNIVGLLPGVDINIANVDKFAPIF